jgi:TonB family protein
MLDGLLARSSPRMPAGRLARRVTTLAVAVAFHLLTATVIVLLLPAPTKPWAEDAPAPPPTIRMVLPSELLFVQDNARGGGGGGGGNRQAGPIRRAEGVGHNPATMRTRGKPPAAAQGLEEPAIVPFVLDARPLTSGTTDQLGLPVGGIASGISTGPGSGGGVGTGTGTGLGSGRGPGVGPGSGGGFGGGAYRPGGAVSPPRVIAQVQPRYSSDALEQKIQGSVWLEVVVTCEGRAGQVRVMRSLDPRGLDEEAIKAVRQWRFDPGRLSGQPVDVVVTVVMDFSIH